jgi:hypothetical protein
MGHTDFSTDIAGKHQEQRADIVVVAGELGASAFEILL